MKVELDKTGGGDVVANFDEVMSEFDREMWGVVEGEKE